VTHKTFRTGLVVATMVPVADPLDEHLRRFFGRRARGAALGVDDVRCPADMASARRLLAARLIAIAQHAD
jgi:hypothetical protein